MDRLNIFCHFESKKEHHEDALTRAVLVVLRLVPAAHARFLSVVGFHRKQSNPALPSPESNPVFSTQVGKIGCSAKTLLSILLTDAPFDEPIPVRLSDRGARYDGVIAYPPDWVFVIENKPHHEHVWREQLSPNITNEDGCPIDKVEELAVVIPWQELLTQLRTLLTTNEVVGTEADILKDFLDYLYEKFSFLNPYPDIASCGDNRELLKKRCRAIMEEVAPGRVKPHRRWKYSIRCEHAAAQEIALWTENQSGGWHLRLEIDPGDTIRQVRRLYGNLDGEGLLGLMNGGWEIRPNFHLAHIQQNILGTNTTMSVADYVTFWQRQQKQSAIEQIEIVDAHTFSKIVDAWRQLGLVNEDDTKEIDEKFTHGNRRKVNVCPGLRLLYCWDAQAAADLDNRGALVQEVKERIREALATWQQPF